MTFFFKHYWIIMAILFFVGGVIDYLAGDIIGQGFNLVLGFICLGVHDILAKLDGEDE